jgi:cellulose synthase operon protein C
VLKRCVMLIAGTFLVAFEAPAQGDGRGDGIHAPLRLTAGAADQLLGQFGPDDRTLYYVSTAEASSTVYVMDVHEGRPRRPFDEGADATWPRASPDGRKLLYISYRDQATGQLCIRKLPSAEGRICLALSGAVQAEWIDSSRIALVNRESLHGDLQLHEVTVGSELRAKPLVPGNATSPAASPDGQWLAYVPVVRDVPEVGPGFAAHATPTLALLRLGSSAPAAALQINLPGLTAQPTFSRDGRFLYFVQFMADSNHDGVVDASDSGILFRIPFAPGSATSEPEQLTDASWNCQYPSTSKTRLVATCTRGESLDVFELPLEGEVPEDWTSARVSLELELVARRSEQLLLYRRHLRDAKTAAGRHFGLIRMVRLHLDANEFDAARFYALAVSKAEDAATIGLGRRLQLWVDHRRQLHERERGREVDTFAQLTRERIKALAPEVGDSKAAVLLGHVIRSELADTLGDKADARRELEASEPQEKTPRPIIELYAHRADALYRSQDQREPLVAVYRRLAAIASLPPDARLSYARAAVRAMFRGRPYDEAERLLVETGRSEPADTELAFALELGRALLLIRDARSPGARTALLDLYKRQQRPDRQRAVMVDAVARASEFGADGVIEELAQDYVEDVPRGTAERARAEALYRHAWIGRAFRERANEDLTAARADFDRVVQHTHSLEALVGSLDLSMWAGERHEAIADRILRTDQPAWLKAFAQAYLQAHDLRTLTGDAHSRAVDAALALLRGAWADLRRQRLAQALVGAIRHEAYLETGDFAQAERASGNYQVALKGLKSDMRLRAMLLGELGLLQTQVGNYRIALTPLDEREQLPYVDNTAGLAVRLARARALLHVGHTRQAADATEQALAMVDQTPRLGEYRVIALDRAALYALAAGRFNRALAHYEKVFELTEASATTQRNRLAARLGHAAAALGARQPEKTLVDLTAVTQILDAPGAATALVWPHAAPKDVLRTYRLISSGLEVNALLQLGRGVEALRALERRRELLAELLRESDRDEDLRAVTLVESQLADNAVDRGDREAAGRWAAATLDHGSAFGERTQTRLSQEERDGLWLAAELAAFQGIRIGDALPARLQNALSELARRRGVSEQSEGRWLEICLALMAL